MPSVDEIIADPIGTLALPEGSIPVSIIVIAEYAHPGSDNHPQRRRLAMISDDTLPPWTALGMVNYAAQLELNSVGELGDQDE